MSNPFVRRRLQTGINISYANKVETQNRENKQNREAKEKENQFALYETLYGINNQSNEQVNPIEEITQYVLANNDMETESEKSKSQQKHPNDPNSATKNNLLKQTKAAKILVPTKTKQDKSETSLARIQKKPLPKLALFVNQVMQRNIYKEPSSARPVYSSLLGKNSFDTSKQNFNRAKRAKEGEKIRSGEEKVEVEKRAPFLPLHYFDNEEYDKGITCKVPNKGAALYFFPFEDALDWKNCNVIGHKPPLFKIKWDGLTKDVYRISLRFDFDDQKAFEKRRLLAFQWRKYFEDQIYLDNFLRNLPIENLAKPPTEIIQNIIKRVTSSFEKAEEVETDNETKSQVSSGISALQSRVSLSNLKPKRIEPQKIVTIDPGVKEAIQKLIPEIISEFYYGEKLANYQKDCENNEIYIKQKDLPKYEFEQHKFLPSRQLKKEKVTILQFPTFKPLYQINSHIVNLKTKLRLFSVDTNIILNYSDFFLYEMDKLTQIERAMFESEYQLFFSETQKLMLNWPFAQNNILIKMLDLRVSDMIYEMIYDDFESFLKAFQNKQIKFILKISDELAINNPTEEEILKEGFNYFERIRNMFKNAKTLLQLRDSADLQRDTEKIDAIYESTKNEWILLIKSSFEKVKILLEDISHIINSIPSYSIKSMDDILNNNEGKITKINLSTEYFENCKDHSDSNNYKDLNALEKVILESNQSFLRFKDEYKEIYYIDNLAVDFRSFREFLYKQNCDLKNVSCEFITDKIFSLINDIDVQTQQLKMRCQFSPETIEHWYNRHILLINLQENYTRIRKIIDNTVPLFNFLETFSFESKVKLVLTFELKSALKNIMMKLPEYLEIERSDLERLTKIHLEEIKLVNEKIKLLFIKVEKYNFKTDFDLCYEYLEQLASISNEYQIISDEIETQQKRDEMIAAPITEFPMINGVKRDIDLFSPIWTIHDELQNKTDEWMSVTFLELSPNDIVSSIKTWKETLNNLNKTFKELLILKSSVPDDLSSFNDVDTNDSMYLNEKVVVFGENHPQLKSIEQISTRIDYLILHVPIIQHLCNPVLRNRHWAQISEVTNFPINQNEGLTWHWLIESGIESKITEIAAISRDANYEYQIEKALISMIEELRSLSVELTQDKGHTRMKDTTPIFKVLSDHQVRIQELFVPPYIKPFMMKIKEYEFLANNLREILTRTLDAQNAIDDLVPAIESKDIRTQNQDVAANYDETVRIFNRLVSKFGDPSQFHDLVSNPKYFSIIDDVQGNISVLKQDLDNVIEHKRTIFPPFRYMSDSQLIHLISYSQDPQKFCTLFASIYSGIEKGLAQEDPQQNDQNEKQYTWIGFQSIDGEIIKFSEPFHNTPESVETIFSNFDNAIIQTLTNSCFNLLKRQTTNINKIVSTYPSQIVCVAYQVFFSQNVEKIFESADIIFSERKTQFLNEQFTHLLNFIQTDITYLIEASRQQPSTSISNLVTVLIKQIDIIKELITEKVDDSNSFRWTRHLRFNAVGTTDIDKFKVIVSCGFNSYEYGFNYTGGGPLKFVTDASEKIYASFMTSLSNSQNSVITGELSTERTNFIINFANLLGKYVFVYNCSSQNTSAMIEKLLETASLTSYFIILRDFNMISNSVISDLTPTLSSFAQKKAKFHYALFATYPSVSIAEPLPPHIRLLFRHVALSPIYSKKIIETFLVGIGFPPIIDENKKLIKQLVIVVDSLSIVSDPKYSAIFSLRNIMSTIADKPLDKENPSFDVLRRLLSQIRHIGNDKTSISHDLLSIFEAPSDFICNTDDDIEIPNELLPSSNDVLKCIKSFMQIIQFHRDVIVLGKPMTGKSTVIKTAAQVFDRKMAIINPNAQNYLYLSSNGEKGLFYDAIQTSQWIIFDSQISDSWMNILAVSMENRDHLYFSDGCRLEIPETTRFIYETDSLSNSTPTILSYCAMIVVPDNSITYKDLLSKFLNKLQNDERLVEPVSGKLFGTQIPMNSFIEKAYSFIDKILLYLTENLEFMIFSKMQSINNFFSVLESMLSVHYYSNSKMTAFEQQNLSQIYDDIENIVIFASIWSFGAMTVDDCRTQFEATLTSFLNEVQMTIDLVYNDDADKKSMNSTSTRQIPNATYFDIYYNTTKQKWRYWEDIGFNNFYSTTTTMTDICPEYLIMDSKTIVSTLYLTNLLISQGKNVLIESSNQQLSSIILHLSIYTEFIGSHFNQHCYQFINSQDMIRAMVDNSLSGIRDGSRSTSRLPLLALLGLDTNYSNHTELLRYILDNGFVLNLNTFTPEITTSISFFFTSTFKEDVNERLLSHLTIIRIPDAVEMENSISQAIDTLCGIKKNHEVASIIIDSLYQIDSKFQFNVFHILKLIQRVAMAMSDHSKNYFLNALSYESVAVLYDYTKSDETINVLNNMLQEISNVLEIGKYEPISEHLNTKFLSNLRSLKYRPISSLDEISTSNSQKKNTIQNPKMIKPQFSLRDLPQIFSHGKYIENFNGLSICFPKTDLSIFDQQNILRLERMITTPKTHILINSKYGINELMKNIHKFLHFDYHVYETGESLIKLLHDYYIKAGKEKKHVVLLINEPFLSKSDLDLAYSMTKNPDLYGLFGPNEMLNIMSELHCKEGDEDPFHEETIGSKANYHLLVRDFVGNCNNFFHLCIVSNEESPNFENFFETCSTLTISMPLQNVIHQTLSTNMKCKYASEILAKLSDYHSNLREIPLLNAIATFNEKLMSKVIGNQNERYETLSKILEICQTTEETIRVNLEKQMKMEAQVQQLASQMQEIMDETSKSHEIAQKEREEIEAEEKTIIEQQKQAEQLRTESEQSLSKTKPLLMQSTQELRGLSNRDISVIKSMNHPPRGVFLVVRSIVVIMGYKIEDKTDEPSEDQPSWILGKKILSDTSFLSNLLKQALENLSEYTLNQLQTYINDPNFTPTVVESSSTAAKSICQFVHAIVPYYDSIKFYETRQQQLKECEENLKSLQKKHDLTAYKLQTAAKDIEESESKMKNLQLNKERIEMQLKDQQANVDKYKSAMQTMDQFFTMCKEAVQNINDQNGEMEQRIYFVSLLLSLYSSYESDKRDEIFTIVKEVFDQDSTNGFLQKMKTREDVMKSINELITINENEYGIKSQISTIENMALFTLSQRSWFFIIDSDATIVSILKPIVTKRLIITSFLSSEFKNDLYNSILGNDILIVYDYNWEIKFNLFNEIFESRGKVMEIFEKRTEIPSDFQIIFIVDIFPDFPVFDSILIENVASDLEIQNNVASKLFTLLDPENSHNTINNVKTLRDVNLELKRTQNELENLLLQNAERCLDDEKISRQFQNASKSRVRIMQQIEKLESVRSHNIQSYLKLVELSKPFADLYHDVQLRDGLQHFYDMLINELISIKLPSDPQFEPKVNLIFMNLRKSLYSSKSLSIPFDQRVKLLSKTANIKLGEYEETITKISEEFDSECLCQPSSIQTIISETSSRRPVIMNCSLYVLKYLTMNDKTIISSVSDIFTNYNEALSAGKTLVTVLTDNSMFHNILSVISKIRSATSLSNDFRLFIFVDYIEEPLDFSSQLLSFCDFIDFNAILNVRRNMSLMMTSLNSTKFVSAIPNKTTFWSRVLFLLSLFDASAGLMSQEIFQNQPFNEDNFELMVDYLRHIENPMFENIGHFFISTFYAVEQPQIFHNLLKIWKNIFNNPENFTSNSILSDKYSIPMNYAPTNVSEIISTFPLIDDPSVFGFETGSNAHFEYFTAQKWVNSKFGKMDFTSIELKLIDVSKVVWYLKYEAEEVNKRFLLRQHRFTRGLRKLLGKLRMVDENPSVDLSVMFKPSLFFSLIRHKYLMSHSSFNTFDFVLTDQKSSDNDIQLENLIVINAEFENGLLNPKTGSRTLPNLYITVQEITDEKMNKIPLYHQGKCLCNVYINTSQDLDCQTVLILTAFTDRTK